MIVRDPLKFQFHSHSDICKLAMDDASTNDVVLVLSVNERGSQYLVDKLNLYTEKFKDGQPQSKMLFVLNTLFAEFDIRGSSDENTIFVEWFELLTYLNILRGQKTNSVVNNNGRGLFKVGKLYNRIRLATMRILIDHELLDEVDYSMYLSDPGTGLYERVQRAHSELTGGDTDINYLIPYVKSLDITDTAPFTTALRDDYHYTGFPYDTAIYGNTSYSVVCETDWRSSNHRSWITEKTYTTIANCHPFLLLGEEMCESDLQQMGYLTYSPLTPSLKLIYQDIHSYGVNPQINGYFIQALENMKDCVQSNYNLIKEMTRYNYEVFVLRNQQTLSRTHDFTDKHNLPVSLQEILYDHRYLNRDKYPG